MQKPSWIETIEADTRIFNRILHETTRGFIRTGWMNLIIVVTMAAILSIFGILLSGMLETQQWFGSLGSMLKISVYLKPDAELSQVVPTIQHLPHVRQVEVIPREKAWDTMKQTYDVPDIDNPLPDALHVEVNSQTAIEPTSQTLQHLPGVEAVQYAQHMLLKLQQLARLASLVGMAFITFLGAMTLFIISNTIHLLIEARSREIEILRMMGVGNWYIRLPFLLQGAFYGLAGALVGFIPVIMAWGYMRQAFQIIDFYSSTTSEQFALIVMLMMGLVVGAGGASVSMRKYLHV